MRSPSLKAWATSAGVGYTLARQLARDPEFPALRLGRRIRVDVKRAEDFLASRAQPIDIARLVDEIARELKSG